MVTKVLSWLVSVDSFFKLTAILGEMSQYIKQSKGTSNRKYIHIHISSESFGHCSWVWKEASEQTTPFGTCFILYYCWHIVYTANRRYFVLQHAYHHRLHKSFLMFEVKIGLISAYGLGTSTCSSKTRFPVQALVFGIQDTKQKEQWCW